MSLFSSLSYILKRAGSALNETAPTSPPLKLKLKPSNEIFKISQSESSTTNSTSYNRYLQFVLDTNNFSAEIETNNSIDLSATEHWKSLFSLPTSTAKFYLDTEYEYTRKTEVQLPNETYHNAELLFESWWNVFDERYLRHGWGWTITLIIAYISILVAGVIGNVMVILVVLMRSQMRTVTNMFITNLAVADLFVIVFCIPSTLLANIFSPWILGSFLCKAGAYVQGVSVCASGYSLAAISLDRCQAVYRNYERPRGFSQKICVRTVIIIWVGAMFLTLPWAVAFEVKVSKYDGFRYCVETWQVDSLGNIYFLVVNLISFYAIPLLLIFVSNWIIYCHVIHRHVPQDSASSAPLRKMHRHTRHVVLRMLGIVTLTFLLCWLPLYVLVIIIKFSQNINESTYDALGILMPIAQWLGSLNSSINPVLYAFLNKKFRRMFKSILPAWVPIKAAGLYRGSIKTPSFTPSVYTGRSRTNSRSDYYRRQQNGRRNYHLTENLLSGRFNESAELIVGTKGKIISTTIPATAVLMSGSLENILKAGITEKITQETVTEL